MIGFLLDIDELLLAPDGDHHERFQDLLLPVLPDLVAVMVSKVLPRKLLIAIATSDLDRLAGVFQVNSEFLHGSKVLLAFIAFPVQGTFFLNMFS